MAPKRVQMRVLGEGEGRYRIEYGVEAEGEQDMSHEVRMTAQLLEVERMAVMRGKTKIIRTAKMVRNTLTARLSK